MPPQFELTLTAADKQTLATLAVGTVVAANAWWAAHLLDLTLEESNLLKQLIAQLDSAAERLNGLALQDSLIQADASISAQQLQEGLARVNQTIDDIKQIKDALKGLAAVLTVVTQIVKAIVNPTPATIGSAIDTIGEIFS